MECSQICTVVTFQNHHIPPYRDRERGESSCAGSPCVPTGPTARASRSHHRNVVFPRALLFGSDMAAKGGRPALRLRLRGHCASPNAGCGWGDAGSVRRRPPRPPNPRYHPPARRCPAAFEPRARRHVRVQAVALQLCSAPGFVSMWIRLVVIGTGHPSSPSFAYRRETNVDVRCAQDPQTDRLRRRRLERFLMGLIVETGAVPPAPFPSRPLRPASRTSCLKFTFCRRR